MFDWMNIMLELISGQDKTGHLTSSIMNLMSARKMHEKENYFINQALDEKYEIKF